jgi:two-component system sensor histidine kinase UhpB
LELSSLARALGYRFTRGGFVGRRKTSNQPVQGAAFLPEDAPPRAWNELRISLIYVIGASAWVVASDQLLDWLCGAPTDTVELQTFKGLNFVFTTAILLYFVLHRSFTRRRQAEAATAEANRRFEVVARASTDAVFDWNLQTGAIWWSEGLQNLFGYPAHPNAPDIRAWTERIHPKDRPRVAAQFKRVLQSNAEAWTDEFRFQRQDGSFANVIARSHVLRNGEGTAVRVVGGLSDVTQQRLAEKQLELSRRQLRALSARLESLREADRTRIAREIHDELGQMLTGLKMDLRWMERRLGQMPDQAALNPLLDKVVEASQLVDTTIATVQKISSELRPGVLDHLGLTAAVQHEAVRFQQRTGIACQAVVPEATPSFSREVATGVFRILQEALTNVTRHANANAVQVELRIEGKRLVLEVADNGKGISETELSAPRSLGLLGMKERAAMLGGELNFHRLESGGTRVTLRVPLQRQDTDFWEMI